MVKHVRFDWTNCSNYPAHHSLSDKKKHTKAERITAQRLKTRRLKDLINNSELCKKHNVLRGENMVKHSGLPLVFEDFTERDSSTTLDD